MLTKQVSGFFVFWLIKILNKTFPNALFLKEEAAGKTNFVSINNICFSVRTLWK